MSDDELSPEEARALSGLSRGPEPPPGLEDATVARLRAGGMLAESSVGVPRRVRAGSPARLAVAAAAAIAFFAAGLFLGSRRGAPAAPGAAASPRFVLLLYDAPGEESLTPAEMARRVSEYRDWAVGLRAKGHEIGGEKFGGDGMLLRPSGEPGRPGKLGGYFVVRAPDLAAAIEIARSCPHFRHGGDIEVRRIEET